MINRSPDPRDSDKKTRRKVVSDDVEAHLPRENEFETSSAVVHAKSHVVSVFRSKRVESDLVVKD